MIKAKKPTEDELKKIVENQSLSKYRLNSKTLIKQVTYWIKKLKLDPVIEIRCVIHDIDSILELPSKFQESVAWVEDTDGINPYYDLHINEYFYLRNITTDPLFLDKCIIHELLHIMLIPLVSLVSIEAKSYTKLLDRTEEFFILKLETLIAESKKTNKKITNGRL